MVGAAIAFDYGAKTFRFGGGLDEAEASHLIPTSKVALSVRLNTSMTQAEAHSSAEHEDLIGDSRQPGIQPATLMLRAAP